MLDEWWDGIGESSCALEKEFKNDMKDPTNRGVAKMYTFSPGGFSAHECEQPEQLHDFLDKEHPGPMLVILEDLSREWVQVLGSKLNIPHYFFALHWALPADHAIGRVWLPVGQCPEQHFILSYTQTLPIQIESNVIDSEYRLNRGALRTLNLRRRARSSSQGDGDTCDQLLSYWGVKHHKGHWAAVLLVDPCPGESKNTYPEIIGTCEKRTVAGFTFRLKTVAFNEAEQRNKPPWKGVATMSRHCLSERRYGYSAKQAPEAGTENSPGLASSMFAELVDFEDHPDIHAVNTPLAVTFRVRRAILARTAGFVDEVLECAGRLTAKAATNVGNIRDFSVEDLNISGWSGKWKGEFFTDMWELRAELDLLSYKMDASVNVFTRIDTVAERANATVRKKAEGGRPRKTQCLAFGDECDLWAWEDLQAKVDYAFKMLERTNQSYVDAVQATAAQFANDQAISARRITGFATIFVPASLCAAVLAIPSFAGASDTEKFWIFWTISLPLGILAWVWFVSPLRDWITKTRADFRKLGNSRWTYLTELVKAMREPASTPEAVHEGYVEGARNLARQRVRRGRLASGEAV